MRRRRYKKPQVLISVLVCNGFSAVATVGSGGEESTRRRSLSSSNLLTESRLALLSDATFRKLQAKRPPASSAITRASIKTPPVQVFAVALRSVLGGSSRGLGPRGNGWRFEHFCPFLDDDAVLTNFLQVCNLFLAGRISSPALAGALLIALWKRLSDSRLIAIWIAFRRRVANLALSGCKKKITGFFSPFLFGVATPRGAEHSMHLFQRCASQHSKSKREE